MNFVAIFDDRTPILVDASDAAEAAARASDLAEGVAPAGVVPLAPGAFAAQIAWRSEVEDDVTEDDDELLVLPFDHTLDVLVEIDDLDPERVRAREAETQPAPVDPSPSSTNVAIEHCASEADGDDGEVYRCELAAGHAATTPHQAHDAGGALVEWTDA